MSIPGGASWSKLHVAKWNGFCYLNQSQWICYTFAVQSWTTPCNLNITVECLCFSRGGGGRGVHRFESEAFWSAPPQTFSQSNCREWASRTGHGQIGHLIGCLPRTWTWFIEGKQQRSCGPGRGGNTGMALRLWWTTHL